eukprot:6474151-Amphidinium_carterae.1
MIIKVPLEPHPLWSIIRESELPELFPTFDVIPWAMLQRILFAKHEELCNFNRLVCIEGNGSAGRPVDDNAPLPDGLLNAVYVNAFPGQLQGGMAPPTFEQALAVAKNAVKGIFRGNQVSLMLSGDAALYNKLVKQLHNESNVKNMLVATAARYGIMQIQVPPHSNRPNPNSLATRSDHVDGPHQQQQQQQAGTDPGGWQVKGKGKGKGKGQGKNIGKDSGLTPPEPAATKPETSVTLVSADWNVPVHDEVRLDTPGVYLVQGTDDSVKLAKVLQHNQHAYALVSLQPLSKSLRSERITFRAKFVSGAKRVISEKLLTGYLNHFGEDRVKCAYKVKHVQVGTGAAKQTVVLSCKSREAMCTPQQWETILNCKDAKTFLAELSAQVPMKALDAFKVSCKQGEFYAMLRVPEADKNRWLDCDFPMAVSPLGDEMSRYKVHWDGDLTYIDDVRDRYVDCPGWAGIVLGRDSVGFRVHAAQHDLAMSYLGKPTGSIYVVTGVPLEASRDEVVEFLEQIEWTCELLAFRKVQYRSAMYRVRSDHAPPHESCMACFGYVRAQVRIQLQTGAKPREQSPVQQAAPPSSWSEAAKRALGPQPVSAAEAPEPPPQREQTADDWGLEDEDDENEDEQDYDMQDAQHDADSEQGSEHSWQPFDLFQDGDNEPSTERVPRPERVPRSAPLAAKPKFAPTPHPTQHEGSRLDALEQRMASMTEMLASFLGTMQPQHGVATQVGTQPPMPMSTSKSMAPQVTARKRDWEEALKPKTARATTSLTVELESSFRWMEVPRDGACAWHALGILVEDKYDEPYHAVQGFHFKSRLIKQIRESATEAADVLGISKPDLLAFLKEITPSTVWADARVLLLIAYVHAVNIMVVNETDGTLELLSPFGDPVPDTVCWPVRFAHSHFSPGKIVDWKCVAQATSDLKFQPWSPQRHLTGGGGDLCGEVKIEQMTVSKSRLHNSNDGVSQGAESHPADDQSTQADHESDAESLMSDGLEWEDLQQQTLQEGADAIDALHLAPEECAYMYAVPDQTIPLPKHHDVVIALNIGSWRAQGHHVRAMALESRSLFMLQEVKLSSDGQAAMRAQCADIGYDCFFGGVSVPTLNAAGHLRHNGGSCPGVAYVFPTGMPVFAVPCETEACRRYEREGRLKLAVIDSQKGRVLLVNLYCPAGPAQQAERTAMQSAVLEELAHHQGHPVVIGGDFNECPAVSTLMGMLCTQGWRCPSVNTVAPIVTYESGPTKSWLDGFLLSPLINHEIQCQWLRELPGLQHRAVYLPLPLPVSQRYPRARRPHAVTRGPLMHAHSPIDWGSVCASLESECLSLSDQGVWVNQCRVDEIWSQLSSNLRTHLYACHHVFDNAGGGELGVSYMNWCPTPRPVKHDHPRCPSTVRVYAALHRLASLVELRSTNAVKRLHSMREFICAELHMSLVDFDLALVSPETWLETWKCKVKLRDERIKHAAIKEWKARLATTRKSPTPELYRWLKGKQPVPSLFMRDASGWRIGPDAYFSGLIEHWSGIHNEEPTMRDDLHEWFMANPMPALDARYNMDVECLLRCVSTMKAKAAAGLDGWPVAALKCIDADVGKALLWMFRICEQLCAWPSEWKLVRVAMIPKDGGGTGDPGALRPISVLSVFFRLWAKYRFYQLEPRLRNEFPAELLGGIRGRDSFGSLLALMLRMEAQLVAVSQYENDHEGAELHPEDAEVVFPEETHVLTIDARKCYDRIPLVDAVKCCIAHGLPLETARPLFAMYAQLTRHYCVAGFLSKQSLCADRGLPQGCLFAVWVTNAIVSTWPSRIRDVGGEG